MSDFVKDINVPIGDTISRPALKNALINWQMEYAEKGKDVERFETLGKVIDLVEQMPTSEPKKGKWISHMEKSREYIGTILLNVEYDYWFCDACGYHAGIGKPVHNFCPHCGAKMEGNNE